MQIENLRLGYRIYYQLNTFTTTPSSYNITGNVRYEPMETYDSVLMNGWNKMRAETYFGSVRHFLKSLIANTIEQGGFQVYADASSNPEFIRSESFYPNLNKTISEYRPADNIIEKKSQNEYKVKLPARLEIHYRNRITPSRIYKDVPYPVSWLEVSGGFLVVTENGIVLNGDRLIVSGAMAEARVSQQLPYDYIPGSVINNNVKRKIDNTRLLGPYLEKPYLHSDKSHYYPNETIWFKAYLNYGAHLMKDSLSRVLNVELIDPSLKIISRKTLPIIRGCAEGNISLATTAPKGDYILRAYTRWMLNFKRTLISSKAIKVLAFGETPLRTKPDLDDVVNGVFITSDKGQYKTREKISLRIEARDFLGQLIPSKLSVSVTDMQQVVAPLNEVIILTDFPIENSFLEDSLPKKLMYTVQTGIELKGQFRSKKGKAVQGVITFLQPNADDLFTVTTDANGNFFMPNLQLYDSIQLMMKGESIKGKQGYVLLDTLKLTPPEIRRVEPLNLPLDNSKNHARFQNQNNNENMLFLKEVMIESKKIEEQSDLSIHSGLADYVIGANVIRNSFDLISLLQSRIPGLRIITFYDKKTGQIKSFLKLGGPSSFNSNYDEPLILLDDVVINHEPGEAVDLIRSLSPSSVDRIEVIKFSGGAAYGARGGNGVIAIYTGTSKTRDNVMEIDLMGFDAIRLPGYSVASKFSSPDYSNHDPVNERQDFRSTILWDANVSTNGKDPAVITFYSSDLPGNYKVIIEGVSDDGLPLRGETTIKIE